MHKWVKGLGVLFTVSAVLGCGGSSGGGTPTSLPPTTKLMTLTPAQQTQVCNDLGKYEAKNISQANACKFLGIFAAATALGTDSTLPDSSLQSACSQAVTQCNSQPASSSGNCDLSGVTTCSADATIAELNTCAMDEVAATNAAFGALPACSAVTKTWLNANPDPTGGFTEPTSCTTLATKCPGVMLGG